MSVSGSELDQPSTQGEGYDRTQLDAANDPERIFPLDINSGSVVIRANPNNSGTVYLGFDDSLTVNNGFPLEAGDALSVDLDVSDQAIWFVGANSGDDVRWLAIN